jgi:hypothetical protein
MRFGIHNYNPLYYKTSSEIINNLSFLLAKLKDQRILNVYSMWETHNKEWDEDSQIIIELSSFNLEVCNYKLNGLTLSEDSIDMNYEIEKIEFGEYGKYEYEWRSGRKECIKFIDAVITGIEIIEQLFDSTSIFNKLNPDDIGTSTSNWILNGIGFNISNGYFSIYNGLDKNSITDYKVIEDNLRYIKIF